MLEDKIRQYLNRSRRANKLKHAYLFEGFITNQAREIIWSFIKSIQCPDSQSDCQKIDQNQHPDVSFIPSGSEIKKIRSLKQYLALSAINGHHKIAFIDMVENLRKESLATLLKTLEEPRGRALLILTTNNASTLPKTILSRCQRITLSPKPLAKQEKFFIKTDSNELFKKPLTDVFKYLEKREPNEVLGILNSWLYLFRTKMLQAEAGSRMIKEFCQNIKKIQSVKKLILRTNINQRLALENLVLEIRK